MNDEDFDPLTETQEPREITTLQQARRNFLKDKQDTVKQSSARSYEYPTKAFIQYCAENGISVTGEITQRIVTTWLDSRKNEVKPITVKNNAKHIRVFLKWMGSRELCDWEIHEKIEMPTVPDRGDVNETVLRSDLAEKTFDYLETYNYATRFHALMYTIWHTGCRSSGVISLDKDDFVSRTSGDNVLKFKDRADTGTPLKNGHNSRRDVTISDKLANILTDYINGHRIDEVDEYDREPLFTVPSGRVYRQRVYKNTTAITRPCVTTGNCPHDRVIEDCTAAQSKEKAYDCPSSVSLHPIRKGAITRMITDGWSKEAVSGRCDVSVEVLNKHYDFRSAEKRREGRSQYIET